MKSLNCDLAVGSGLKTGIMVLQSPAFRAVIEHLQYTVERRPGSWIWRRWQVRPAKASGVLFTGTEYQCLRVHQALITASRNGAWVALLPEYHTV